MSFIAGMGRGVRKSQEWLRAQDVVIAENRRFRASCSPESLRRLNAAQARQDKALDWAELLSLQRQREKYPPKSDAWRIEKCRERQAKYLTDRERWEKSEPAKTVLPGIRKLLKESPKELRPATRQEVAEHIIKKRGYAPRRAAIRSGDCQPGYYRKPPGQGYRPMRTTHGYPCVKGVPPSNIPGWAWIVGGVVAAMALGGKT